MNQRMPVQVAAMIAAVLAGALAAAPAMSQWRDVTVQDVEVEEGEDVTFTFKPASTGVYFRYKYETVDGGAVGGRDYTSKSGWLVFPHTATEVTLTVSTLVDDDMCENDETFTVKLSNPQDLVHCPPSYCWANWYSVPLEVVATATIEGWGLDNSGNYATQHLGCGGGFGE